MCDKKYLVYSGYSVGEYEDYMYFEECVGRASTIDEAKEKANAHKDDTYQHVQKLVDDGVELVIHREREREHKKPWSEWKDGS